MIVVKPLEGLCNRMRVINSCIELQKRNPNAGNIQMVWENNDSLNCDFDELFEPIENVQVVRSHKALDFFLDYHNNSSLPFKSVIRKYFRFISISDYKYYDTEIILPLRFNNGYWDSSKNKFVINTYADFYDGESFNNYQLFRPVSRLQNLIDAEVAKFTKPTIGVHIRRTDNKKSIEASTNEMFVDRISALLEKDSNQLFFLATDDPDVEFFFKARFKNHIITRENKELKRNSKKGIQDALIDLYALSNTTSILGSYWSSFSKIAARINQVPIETLTDSE